jgi:hypothetical protein
MPADVELVGFTSPAAEAVAPAPAPGTASVRAQPADDRRAAPRRRTKEERVMRATMRVARRTEES